MRYLRPYQIFLIGTLILIMASASFASTGKAVVVDYTPQTLTLTGTPPSISAKAYAIFDVRTGDILASLNLTTTLPIASVTKLLTAATVLKNISAEETYRITEADTTAHGRAGRLSVGEVYNVHELLFPLLLESSNDAAAVFERETGGKIIGQMNELAEDLGAETFSVVDASGISDSNTASVKDLVIITTHLYNEMPHLFDITQLSKRAGPYISWTNNNPVRDDSYKGGKHGYTETAKRTLVAVFNESLVGGQKEVGYVLLGSDDLVTDVAILRKFLTTAGKLE